jgi:ribosome-binding factor A
MASTDRARRVAERIREELADIFLRESSDPRFRLLSITDVQVDREFAVASVFVSAVDCDAARIEEIQTGLDRARGFLRSALAARITLRVFPQLRFHWDYTPERAEHLESLIDSLKQDKRA